MKNILFLTKSAPPQTDANYNCIAPLIDELSVSNNVFVCAFSCGEDKNNIYFLGNPTTKEKLAFYHNILPKNNLLIKAIGPKYLKSFLKTSNKHYLKIKKIIIEKKIDTVVACSAPFFTNIFAYKLKNDNDLKNIKFVSIFMDPYSDYIEHRKSKDKLIKQEEQILPIFDHIFVPPELYEYYSKLLNESPKITSIVFPSFNLQSLNIQSKIAFEKPTLIYAGSYNEQIRDFKYFYSLADKVNNINTLFILNCDNDIQKYLNKVKKSVNCVDFKYNLPQNELLQYLYSKNSILLNFGNKSSNQLPSKIFQYISTGKPIINVCNREDDTTSNFLKNYPISIDVFTNKSIDENAKLINDFINKENNKTVPYKTLEKEYGDFDKSSVIPKYISIIEKI